MQVNKVVPVNSSSPFISEGRIGHYEWDDGPTPFHMGRYQVALDDGKTIEFLSFIPADEANAVLAETQRTATGATDSYTSRWVVVARRWKVLQVDNRDVELQRISKVIGAANTLDDCERYVQIWFDYLVDALYVSLEVWIDNAVALGTAQAIYTLVTDPNRQQSD